MCSLTPNPKATVGLQKNIVRSNLVCLKAFLGEFGRACPRLQCIASLVPCYRHVNVRYSRRKAVRSMEK